MGLANTQHATGLVLPEELLGKTVVVERADDSQLVLRVLGSQRKLYYVVGANGLYVSEALSA